jgi:TDG/mug DNA glycosylase family protein
VAFVGVVAYRSAFGRPRANIGLQDELVGDRRVWVLPNPSGLNAHYQLAALVELFHELHDALKSGLRERSSSSGRPC